jgi:hypothetical protein
MGDNKIKINETSDQHRENIFLPLLLVVVRFSYEGTQAGDKIKNLNNFFLFVKVVSR